MRDRLQELVDLYTAALQEYLAVSAEAALERAYLLGRKAVADGLGVLDIASAHQEALVKVLLPACTTEERMQTAKRASAFLVESLSPFEMTHRGFKDTIARLVETNQTLRKSEAKNRALLNAIPDTMFRLSKDGTYLDFKAGQPGAVALPPTEVVGKNVTEVLPTELARQVMQQTERALQDGTTQVLEYQLPLDGTMRHYEARLVVSGADEVLAIVRDVTERKRAEEERERLLARERAARAEAEVAERRLAFLAEASKELTSSLDYETTLAKVARLAVPYLADLCFVDIAEEDGAVHRLAAAAADPAKEAVVGDLLRYRPEPTRPQPIVQVLRTGQAVLYREFPDSLLVAIADDARRLKLARKLGITSLMVVPIQTRGRVLGVLSFAAAESGRHYSQPDLALAEDLAGRVAAAVDNARLYRAVQEALRLREEFMAAAAHELKTPVTTIKGWAELLFKSDTLQARERKAIETISQQADRIRRLIEDLLATIRLRPGPAVLRRERFDLGALAREVVEQVARTMRQHQFRVEAASPLFVEGDRPLVGEAVDHLLENAMRYMPAGGPIDVVVRRADGEAIVSVQDRGYGVPSERQAYVFEPFYQPVPAGVPGYVGIVTLGLYLSKQIVEAHGGRIWFVSTPAEGSTFSFSLPLFER